MRLGRHDPESGAPRSCMRLDARRLAGEVGYGLPRSASHHASIATPTLTQPQQLRSRGSPSVKTGAWARALVDGTAEAFSAHRGGLRRFAIDATALNASQRRSAPVLRFLWGRRIALAALAPAALGGLDLVLRIRGGEDVGLRWLWPAGCLLVVAITAAACFGIYARLPERGWDAGEWVGLPGPTDGDGSGHTMPGFVKANPIFCGLWLVLLNAFPIAISAKEIVRDAYRVPLGIVVGTSAWWFWMLCFSRGWVKKATRLRRLVLADEVR